MAAGGEHRARLRAVWISLAVSGLLLAAKYQAYRLTGTPRPVRRAGVHRQRGGAVFAIGALIFAGRPADRNHPYGHGKMSSSARPSRCGLIAFAALVILYEVVQSLTHGWSYGRSTWAWPSCSGRGWSTWLLGYYLIRAGRHYDSLTLIATAGTCWPTSTPARAS